VCFEKHEYIRTIANRNDTPICCNTPTNKTLDTPMVSAMAWTGHQGFMVPSSENGGKGTWIESGSQYNRWIKDNNKIVGNEGISEVNYQKKQIEKKVASERHQAVVEVVNKAIG
jgi:hypothetical protein